ncbi:hypothetical protein [Micromonospora sp. NPDC049679]|uniref:hypothetical protein n=1 Tax=Micromonospora sp. NPDC049679 TaxID=3155920 RepID=UPI0033C67524
MLELTVVGLDRIVGVLLDVVLCRGDQVVAHAGAASVPTSLGVTFSARSARWKKPAGRRGITADRDEHVNDLPVLESRRTRLIQKIPFPYRLTGLAAGAGR